MSHDPAVKEAVLRSGDLVPYRGDAERGLTIERASGAALTLSPTEIQAIFERFGGYNPLLLERQANRRSSLEQFVEYVAHPGQSLVTGSVSGADAYRILAVFVGEGLLGMGEEFPSAPFAQCVQELTGRDAILREKRLCLHIRVDRVEANKTSDGDVMCSLRLIPLGTRRLAYPSFTRPFEIGGQFSADAALSNGVFTVPYSGCRLLTAPSVVAHVLEAVSTIEDDASVLEAVDRIEHPRFWLEEDRRGTRRLP
jgi:hypothetical protein